MINYEDLTNLLENTDISYFSIVADSHEVYKDLKGKLTKVSSFFAVQKLLNKVSLEEYTQSKYQKIEQDADILIEKEIKNSAYKFVKLGSFNNITQMLSSAISIPAMYVFIESGTTFDQLSKNLYSSAVPLVLVKYRSGKFNIDGKIFSSMESVGTYLMKKYYL